MTNRLNFRRASLFAAFCSIFLFSLDSDAQKKGVPTYEQHRVSVSKIRLKQPRLSSHKDAPMFRTNLRNAARKGVNFAGHYALTYWGCGASCGVGAIVDLKTGTVYFPDQLDGVWASGYEENTAPFGYRKDSKLLVLNGYLPDDYNGKRVTYGLHYFVWTGSRLKQIKFIPKSMENGN